MTNSRMAIIASDLSRRTKTDLLAVAERLTSGPESEFRAEWTKLPFATRLALVELIQARGR
jgi:hypothetical protein